MNIIAVIDLDQWYEQKFHFREAWLRDTLKQVHRDAYTDNQRIKFTLTVNDNGIVIKNLAYWLAKTDITAFFVIIESLDPNTEKYWKAANSPDSTTPTFITMKHTKEKPQYKYNDAEPVKISLADVSDREKFLLSESKTFCMYPWIHLHAYPTGEAYPCCMASMRHSIGNARNSSLKEIWNDQPMRDLRLSMLNEQQHPACTHCYEKEESGFFSGRQSANKHHGHHVNRALNTNADGTSNQFEMIYWDIRFSNLCNLRCRSCGHIFSSQWYQDQAKLAGGDWKKHNSVLNYAGRTETDIWEQLEPHLDYVEQIYFAGGEPLLMEEHYHILDELVKRNRTDVRLIYNTNFTHTDLKGKSVFEYWKKFKSVAVGASLDGMGKYGEYIRKGTDWEVVEQNRRDMLAICPEVDFYISPTLSIMNAWHLPDFHRSWVNQGLIRAQDLNVNILQDPAHYRIDIAPVKYKQRIRIKYEEHIEWLRSQDPLRRATVGFESAINFMMSADNTHLIDTFWRKTNELDAIRNENCLEIIPELQALK